MENKNQTIEKNEVIASSTESSTIYLKKKDLPKNISAFANDREYISLSDLVSILNTKGFIDKSTIEELINNSNSKIIDSINKEYSDDELNKIKDILHKAKGEIVEIKEHMNGISWIEED